MTKSPTELAGPMRGRWSAFASADQASPERRPTDAVLLAGALGLLGWTAWRVDPPSRVDTLLGDALQGFPAFFDPIWQLSIDLIAIWCIILVGAALFTRRFGLLLQLVLASLASIGLVAVIGRATLSEWPDLLDTLSDSDGPPVYPATRIALVTAVATTASPALGRPFRVLGRWLLGFAVLGAIALGITLPAGAVAAIAIGVAVAAVIHLVFGSPGWRPNTALVAAALERAGLEIEVDGEATYSGGVARIPVVDHQGRRLSVDVHGRDAWQDQFLSSLFRFLAYRDSGPNFTTGRVKQVEHEAFVTLLAERSGASVAGVVTVIETEIGDAVLVVERTGEPLSSESPAVPQQELATQLWSSLEHLHAASIAHGRVDHRAVVADPSGTIHLTNFAAASIGATADRFRADNAQALTLIATLVGNEQAVASALSAIGAEALGDLVSYLQRPVLSPTLREAVKYADVDLDDLRELAAEVAAVEKPELVKLRRVTWGSVIQVVLVLIAAWVIIGAISSVGLETLWDNLSNAQPSWVIAAVVLSQSARLPAGVATMGATIRPIRLWPAVALDFAIAFVNLAVPATAARVAVKVRFFQRHGASAPEALSVGVLDSVVNTAIQAMILIGVPLLGLASLDLNLDLSAGGHTELVLVVAAILVAAVLLTVFVERLRNLVVPPLKKMASTFNVLRSPQKLAMLVGGNLGSQIGFAFGIWASLHAFGQSAGIVELLFVNAAVSLVAGLLPIPGGIGVSEAGLAAGFVALGVPSDIAVAAAILYRITSFYLPPIGGYFCLRWLERHDYL